MKLQPLKEMGAAVEVVVHLIVHRPTIKGPVSPVPKIKSNQADEDHPNESIHSVKKNIRDLFSNAINQGT